MKTSVIMERTKPEKVEVYSNSKRKHSLLKRISPFFLLSLFLIFLFPYAVITSTNILSARLIILPFVIANLLLVDFAIWNYLQGRKQWLIWITETAVSAMISYWLV